MSSMFESRTPDRVGFGVLLPLLFCDLAYSQPPHKTVDQVTAGHETADNTMDWAAGGMRLEYDNDVLVNSDDKFTNGFSVQWHSRLAREWDDVPAPRWTKFGRRLPGLNAPGLYRRIGIAVGQNMQTPKDLSATELIADDVPYAGSLGFELNWLAFDDDQFRAYALIVGVVGPASGAEAVQKWVHKTIGSEEPLGWDNQLPNEPAVNFNGMFKKKVFRVEGKGHWSADVALNADFGLGTGLTFGEVAAELRAGLNVPYGFAFVPDPVGRTIAYDATVPHQSSKHLSIYASLVLRQIYMQHFIFVDGSLWQDTHSVDSDHWQNQMIVGFHVTGRRWGVHLSLWDSSANLRTPLAGSGNDFGTIAFEWRF